MKEIQKNRSQYSNNKQKNSSLKTIQIQNGSTKATSSLLGNGFLSQEFIVSKDKNQRKKVQNQKISKKQNLFDLERTLDINIEILRNYFKTTTTTMTLLNQDKKILEEIENIAKRYEKKKEIIQKIKEKKSKNLIQLQIFFEHKRKLEESIESKKDSLFDNEDAVNNKDEYVKLFQKKFIEVEIYLKRVTSDMPDTKRKKYYQNYKMDNFLILNTTLNKKKQKIIEDITKYDEAKKSVKLENQKIKKDEIILHNKDDEEEDKIKNETENIKIKTELNEEYYNRLINKKKAKIEKLQNFFNFNMDKIHELLGQNESMKNINIDNINIDNINLDNINIDNINENKKESPKFKKVIVKKKKNERSKMEIKEDDDDAIKISKLPKDMTNRMNSFVELSFLNDNSRIKQSVNRYNNISRFGGDISAIDKIDD